MDVKEDGTAFTDEALDEKDDSGWKRAQWAKARCIYRAESLLERGAASGLSTSSSLLWWGP